MNFLSPYSTHITETYID